MAQQGGFRGGVFISYRRDPALEDARKLHGLLKARLGERRVFFDQRAIPPGAGFPEEIETALRQAHLILFVIAPGWADEFRNRENGAGVDWVRREVQITYERRRDGMVNPPNVRVALVGGGQCPQLMSCPMISAGSPASMRTLPVTATTGTWINHGLTIFSQMSTQQCLARRLHSMTFALKGWQQIAVRVFSIV